MEDERGEGGHTKGGDTMEIAVHCAVIARAQPGLTETLA